MRSSRAKPQPTLSTHGGSVGEEVGIFEGSIVGIPVLRRKEKVSVDRRTQVCTRKIKTYGSLVGTSVGMLDGCNVLKEMNG